MSLINCPKCGKQISDRAVSCPECGFEVTQKANKESSSLIGNAQNETTLNTRKNKPVALAIKAVAVLAVAGISFAAGMAFSGNKTEEPKVNTSAPNEDTAAGSLLETEVSSDQNESEFKVEWVEGAPEQFGSNGSMATPGEARIVKSSSGEYVLTIDFVYTNESGDAKNFINDMYCRVDPYQGGIELDTPGITSEEGAWNYNDAFTSIKQGATVETQLAWVLRDTESPIEIEFGMNSEYKPLFIKTLSIS